MLKKVGVPFGKFCLPPLMAISRGARQLNLLCTNDIPFGKVRLPPEKLKQATSRLIKQKNATSKTTALTNKNQTKNTTSKTTAPPNKNQTKKERPERPERPKRPENQTKNAIVNPHPRTPK